MSSRWPSPPGPLGHDAPEVWSRSMCPLGLVDGPMPDAVLAVAEQQCRARELESRAVATARGVLRVPRVTGAGVLFAITPT